MGWAAAITLCPFGIYVKEQYLTRERTINHEKIHWQQQLEMIVVGGIIALLTGILLVSFNVFSLWLITLLAFPFLFFYLWYLVEWLIRIFVNGNAAYRSLSFEREAYSNAENMNYLKTRKRFAWLRFMKE